MYSRRADLIGFVNGLPLVFIELKAAHKNVKNAYDDTQIYTNFADAQVVTEPHTQASSSQHLKELLQEDHRFIFTLIHKFHADKGTDYPKLTDRSDIIIIADEAHRTQYTSLALNMRNALPNAAFIAFTGTPLIAGKKSS
jgi:type I restriction enzyme, R subunit